MMRRDNWRRSTRRSSLSWNEGIFRISVFELWDFFSSLMKSMTGFGRATATVGNHTLAVQVSAVNRKTLDLTVKLPPAWAAFEVVVG